MVTNTSTKLIGHFISLAPSATHITSSCGLHLLFYCGTFVWHCPSTCTMPYTSGVLLHTNHRWGGGQIMTSLFQGRALTCPSLSLLIPVCSVFLPFLTISTPYCQLFVYTTCPLDPVSNRSPTPNVLTIANYGWCVLSVCRNDILVLWSFLHLSET